MPTIKFLLLSMRITKPFPAAGDKVHGRLLTQCLASFVIQVHYSTNKFYHTGTDPLTTNAHLLNVITITIATMHGVRRHAKFEVAEPIHCRIIAFLLIHYFTLWPWPLTSDLEHLQRIARDVVKLCTKFERNRAIRGGGIAISMFDLITLNMCYVLRSALG